MEPKPLFVAFFGVVKQLRFRIPRVCADEIACSRAGGAQMVISKTMDSWASEVDLNSK